MIAEMMIEGKQCSWCGIMFTEEHGYPVICENCYANSTEYERVGLQKAEYEEV